MSDELKEELEFQVLAELLKADKQHSRHLIEHLATVLESALPENTEVKRSGGLFSKKEVTSVELKFEHCHLRISRKGSDGVHADEKQIVRGVVLKTSDVDVDQWINRVAKELNRVAQQNSKAREALTSFLQL